MEWRGKKVVVVGLARSGQAAAKLLLHLGAQVIGTDLKERGELGPSLDEIAQQGANLFLGAHPTQVLEGVDCLVVSPGVPEDTSFLSEAKRRNIPTIGEIEFAYSFLDSNVIVAVTGTNGKTTTTALVGAMLKNEGRRVWIGGNMAPGESLSEIALKASPHDVIVVEVSTFQLETIERFRAHVGILTNITPDHLDRHPDFQSYANLKARLFENQTQEDWAVLNGDDSNVAAATTEIHSQKVFFSREGLPEQGVGLEGGTILTNLGARKRVLLEASEIKLRGMHNVENAMGAAGAALIMGASDEAICDALRRFHGVPHRLEEISKIRGVLFINNSMCTNPMAGARSLEAFSEPIILIAGGKDKGLDLQPFYEVILRKAKAVILIGDNARQMKSDLERAEFAKCTLAGTMKEAVRLAYLKAVSGDVVLLCPGCASFGLFRDFMDRGDQFKAAVKHLEQEKN
jgi:UDP-N-acetylmuramoylalanine--D-glutamate ligase